MKTVTLIPGDGIGLEITKSVKAIFEAAGVSLTWEEHNAGQTALDATGELIPEALLKSIARNKVALKGPVSTPVGHGFRSINVSLRKYFDLYSNIRPARTLEGVETRWSDVDIVLFRENTEGLYAGLEIWDESRQIADAIKRISRSGSERIIRAAFEYAKANGRKRVTVLHKANIMKRADGLFLNVAREMATEYPSVELKDLIIDNAFMQLVARPEQFDVLVTMNLYGDIVSDLIAGMVGGLGVVPGGNIGKELAIFEAAHGSAPDIAGQGIANPTGILMSGIMMLRHLELNKQASIIENALLDTLKHKDQRTRDLGGPCNTQEFTQHVIAKLKA